MFTEECDELLEAEPYLRYAYLTRFYRVTHPLRTQSNPDPRHRMASTVQIQTYSQPPPTFARHEHYSSMNGSFSQSQYPSLDTSQSVASTPAATPPPPRPTSQQQMSYNIGGGPVMNGMTPRSSFGGYPEINGYNQQQYYSNGIKPQIYTVSSGLTLNAAAAFAY